MTHRFRFLALFGLLTTATLAYAQVPTGEDSVVHYGGAGEPTLDPTWKKCALQGHGRLASLTPWTLTYSFYDPATSGPVNYPVLPEHVTANRPKVAFSAGAKQAIRDVLWNVVSVAAYRDFVEVADTPTSWGQIRFFSINYPLGYWGAVETLPTGETGLGRESDIVIRSAYDVPSTVDWRGYNDGIPYTHGYRNILHEVGHALGLKHPFQGDVGIHPTRPDCYFPDGNDPAVVPLWPGTPVGTPNPPAPSTIAFCPYIFGQQGTNYDNSLYSIMTYRFRNLCNPAILPEATFGLFDKPVLKDLYYYNNGG